MWTSTNGENIWSMARWRWRSSTAWSKERSSSRSKARLIAPLWPKAREIRPESRSRQLLPYFCAHRRPDRNPTPGSLSTAILVPFFAATDNHEDQFRRREAGPEERERFDRVCAAPAREERATSDQSTNRAPRSSSGRLQIGRAHV